MERKIKKKKKYTCRIENDIHIIYKEQDSHKFYLIIKNLLKIKSVY